MVSAPAWISALTVGIVFKIWQRISKLMPFYRPMDVVCACNEQLPCCFVIRNASYSCVDRHRSVSSGTLNPAILHNVHGEV